jgi:hypothetical protein
VLEGIQQGAPVILSDIEAIATWPAEHRIHRPRSPSDRGRVRHDTYRPERARTDFGLLIVRQSANAAMVARVLGQLELGAPTMRRH